MSNSGEKIILDTERLMLRELLQSDYDGMCLILKDIKVMYAYEHAFSDDEVHCWLDKQIMRYSKDGFGLWAVVLKETGAMIGQCGLTMQDCNGREVVEVGYLFQRKYWHNGYATEAAIACKNYAFDKLNIDEVYSIIRDNNIASQNVARRNGMQPGEIIKKFYYNVDMPHIAFFVKK